MRNSKKQYKAQSNSVFDFIEMCLQSAEPNDSISFEIEARPNPKDSLLGYTWCVLEEVDFGNWGIGGNVVTPEILKAVIEGKT